MVGQQGRRGLAGNLPGDESASLLERFMQLPLHSRLDEDYEGKAHQKNEAAHPGEDLCIQADGAVRHLLRLPRPLRLLLIDPRLHFADRVIGLVIDLNELVDHHILEQFLPFRIGMGGQKDPP